MSMKAEGSIELSLRNHSKADRRHSIEQPPRGCATKVKSKARQLLEKFVEKTIPDGAVDKKDLWGAGLAIPISVIYQCVFAGVFAYFFVTSYFNAVQTTFLSPIDADNTGQICETVPVTLSTSYKMDKYGSWEGEDDYLGNSAVYELEFIRAQLSPTAYTNMMTNFKDTVAALKMKAQSREYAWNLMAWTAFNLKYVGSGADGDKGTVNFYSTGTAQYMYNQVISSAAVTRSNGDMCHKDGMKGSYDFAKSTLTLSIPVESVKDDGEYVATLVEPCPNVFVLKDFGYTGSSSTSTIEIDFDVRSINTAVALNFGIISISDLEHVATFTSSEVGKTLAAPNYIGLYKDTFYPDMSPVLCANLNASFWGDTPSKYGMTVNATGVDLCLVVAGDQFFYPIIQHSGRDFYNYKGKSSDAYAYAKYCWTQRDKCNAAHARSDDDYADSVNDDNAAEYYRNYKKDCEDLNMLVGLVFFPDYQKLSLMFFNVFQDIINQAADGDVALIDKAFKAMQRSSDASSFADNGLLGLINGSTAVYEDYFNSSKNCPATYQTGLIEGFDELCGSFSVGCSMVTFNVARKRTGAMEYQSGLVINNEFLTLQNLSHSNTFSMETPLDAMIATPPVSLVEDFLNCHLGPSNAIINSAGISMSNTSVLGGMIMFLFMFALRKYWNNYHTKTTNAKKLVEPDEKDDLYRKLVIAMFQMIRDGNSTSAKFTQLVECLKSFDMDPNEPVAVDELLEEFKHKNMILEDDPPPLPDELVSPDVRLPNKDPQLSGKDPRLSGKDNHAVAAGRV